MTRRPFGPMIWPREEQIVSKKKSKAEPDWRLIGIIAFAIVLVLLVFMM